MDDNLIGYLLEALDPAAAEAVEEHLAANPSLRARLQALERGLAPLASDAEPPEPPPTLVLDTLARIAEYRCRSLPLAPPPPRSQAGWSVRRWLRRPDALVAAALFLVTTGVVLTALVPLWQSYRRQRCADNLRGFGAALASYSDSHDGSFPSIETHGPHSRAGILVPMLHDSGVLDLDHVKIACPAPQHAPHCPSLQDLQRLYARDRAAFAQAMHDMVGNYAYSLGYEEDGVHHGLGRSSGDLLPIMADRLQSLEQPNSPNHGGGGQNVLYVGGHVFWRGERTAGVGGDDIYTNRNGQVRAGLDHDDTVLGCGNDSPGGPED
jgi:hypothetical protein